MLTERERNEVVAAVARDLGVAVSPNDPVFVAVAANERRHDDRCSGTYESRAGLLARSCRLSDAEHFGRLVALCAVALTRRRHRLSAGQHLVDRSENCNP
jgi:hypothetical protein